MRSTHAVPALAVCANVILPGAGLIVIGSELAGLILGLAFIAAANLAIAVLFLFPADFSPAAHLTAVLCPAFLYLAAQLRLAQAVRTARIATLAARRRALLSESRAATERGDYEHALHLLAELSDQNPRDLLPLVRRAQVLAAAGRSDEARQAWTDLQRLDRHGVYHAELRRALAGRPTAPPASPARIEQDRAAGR